MTAPHADAQLIALCMEAVQNHAQSPIEEMKWGSPERKAAQAVQETRSFRWHELCDEIAATPASTLEGMKAKAAVLADVIALEEPLVASLCLDLLGRDRPGIEDLLEAEGRDAASNRAPSASSTARAEENVA